jgi:hypothetical protein
MPSAKHLHVREIEQRPVLVYVVSVEVAEAASALELVFGQHTVPVALLREARDAPPGGGGVERAVHRRSPLKRA